jgi:hypothetical protein
VCANARAAAAQIVADLRLALDAERRRNAELEAHAERTQRALRQEAEEQRMRVLFIEKARARECATRLQPRARASFRRARRAPARVHTRCARR